MSSPQTGPSSERHQHSALLAVFFCPASFFACCSIIDTFSAVEIFELFCCLSPSFPRPVVVSCVGSLSLEPPAFLCPPLPGSPVRLDPPQTQGARSCNWVLLQFSGKKHISYIFSRHIMILLITQTLQQGLFCVCQSNSQTNI